MTVSPRTASPQWRARQPQVAKWREMGFHAGRNLGEEIESGLARHAGTRVVFAVERRVTETTAGELWSQSARIAAALAARGFVAGDVLVNQLPSCRETMLLFLAAARLGLVLVPVVHIYGAAELGYILRTTKARALAMPGRWRNIDFAARLSVTGTLPDLELVIAIGDGELPGPSVRWEELESCTAPPPERSRAGADGICMLNFTSGTTAAPKGVMHSHHSLLAAARSWPPQGLDIRGAPILKFGPAGHIGAVMCLPRAFLFGDDMIHVDHFEPGVVVELCDRYRVRRSGGVPTHVVQLLEATGGRLPGSITDFLVGATSVPPAMIERLERLGARAARSWGCTEHPAITGGGRDDPLAKRANTDGRPMPGTTVRVADDQGRSVPQGEPGELLSIGPQMFQGYLDAALDEAAFTPDGYFRTGDVGVIDAEGFVTLVDRKKDIVVRGGENISSREVEERLLEHPAVREAAVIGWPDERLGERVGAFVQLRGGASLTIEEVRGHFRALGVARQKTPEHLVLVADFPRTAAGKVVKADLRKRVREGTVEGSQGVPPTSAGAAPR